MFKVKYVIGVALNDLDYLEIVNDILTNEEVLKMKNFIQHGDTTCYEHSINVSYLGYVVAKKFGKDYISIARAGLLHDLFLYNWRDYKCDKTFKESHAYVHGKIALANAEKLFTLTKKEKEMIAKHMWPITIVPPRYLMTYFIGAVDKYCAVMELFGKKSTSSSNSMCTDP